MKVKWGFLSLLFPQCWFLREFCLGSGALKIISLLTLLKRKYSVFFGPLNNIKNVLQAFFTLFSSLALRCSALILLSFQLGFSASPTTLFAAIWNVKEQKMFFAKQLSHHFLYFYGSIFISSFQAPRVTVHHTAWVDSPMHRHSILFKLNFSNFRFFLILF